VKDRVLSIDVGNTTAHLCEIKEGDLKDLGRVRHDDLEAFRGRYERVVAVSVRESFNERLREIFGEGVMIIGKEDVPLDVDYQTPQTLGMDRLVLAYGVKEIYSSNAVIVSCGTALVIDLLEGGVFRGGFITAGPRLKASCLSSRAEGIPEVELTTFEGDLGKSTHGCVIGGIYLESRNFIINTAKRWSEILGKKLPLYITGGDGWIFEDLGVYDPLLIHRAVQRIIINR